MGAPCTPMADFFRILRELLTGGAPVPGVGAMRREQHRLVQGAFASGLAHRALEELCVQVGSRPDGSPAAAAALDWAEAWMRRGGLREIRREPVAVPLWVRGEEHGEVLAPRGRPLPLLGLGGSLPTPPGGLIADLVAVDAVEALEALPRAEVEGKIALLDVPTDSWEAWVRLRVSSASRAARCGAAAVLVRALAVGGLAPPRTGSLVYEFGPPRIPAAAISAEEAILLHRELRAGEAVRLALHLDSRRSEDGRAYNIRGELPGSERPEEVVLLCAHLDSWDVGQGAQDNGAGCALLLEVARLLGELPQAPGRTVRVLLAAGGVAGSRGLKAYLEGHAAELGRHIALLEVDGGAGPARGLLVAPPPDPTLPGRRFPNLNGLAPRLEPLGAGRITEGGWGWDVETLGSFGVPMLFLDQDWSRYVEVLHSAEDRIERVQDAELRRNAAILAVTAVHLATSSCSGGEG